MAVRRHATSTRRTLPPSAPVPGAMTTGEEMTFAGRLVSDEAADVLPRSVCGRRISAARRTTKATNETYSSYMTGITVR